MHNQTPPAVYLLTEGENLHAVVTAAGRGSIVASAIGDELDTMRRDDVTQNAAAGRSSLDWLAGLDVEG